MYHIEKTIQLNFIIILENVQYEVAIFVSEVLTLISKRHTNSSLHPSYIPERSIVGCNLEIRT